MPVACISVINSFLDYQWIISNRQGRMELINVYTDPIAIRIPMADTTDTDKTKKLLLTSRLKVVNYTIVNRAHHATVVTYTINSYVSLWDDFLARWKRNIFYDACQESHCPCQWERKRWLNITRWQLDIAVFTCIQNWLINKDHAYASIN